MIIGEFDQFGRPLVEGRLIIPRLRIEEDISFLLDTGSGSTCLHPEDAITMGIPFDQLGNMTEFRGVGGGSPYFREPAILEFSDGRQTRFYGVRLLIAEPRGMRNGGLPSLLGRDVVNQWYMHYDPTNGRLEFEARGADYTLDNL